MNIYPDKHCTKYTKKYIFFLTIQREFALEADPLFCYNEISFKNSYDSWNSLCTNLVAGVSVIFQLRKDKKLNKEKDYIQFLSELKVRVEAYFDGKVTGEVCTSVKNNGVTVTGLLLKGEKERVAPNFYLENQYVEWMRGIQTLEEICNRLCDSYRDEVEKSRSLLTEIKFEWEEFRRKVFMRLVNKERNANQLELIPYKDFMDLAIVYYYSVNLDGDAQGTLLISNEHMELLGVSEDELHQAAENNCQRYQPVKLRCMQDLLYDLGRKIGVEISESKECYPYMFVLTNTKGMFGAVAMTCDVELECFAKRIGKGFYILPSSVHEVILVPENKEFCIEYFASMVREINETQLDPTEVLSDSIYYYDKETLTLRRVA